MADGRRFDLESRQVVNEVPLSKAQNLEMLKGRRGYVCPSCPLVCL